MAIQKDPDGHSKLKQVVSRRLRAARRSAGLSEQEAAEALSHRGLTQVSLAESGGRIPPLLDMVKYADMYCTSIDFLVGRIDDPLAEEDEHSQSLIARNVGQSLTEYFFKFTDAMSDHAAVCISGQRADRRDLMEAAEVAREVKRALKRIRELNPEYEDLRGGATLEGAVSRLEAIGAKVEMRIKSERIRFDMIDKALNIEDIDGKMEQFALALHP